MTGWIKIHRQITENPIWADSRKLKLWMLCLLKASHKSHEVLVGNQLVKLEPGQFVTGRDALAEEFNKGMKKDDRVTSRGIWKWLKIFEKAQMCSIESTTKYSVVTVMKWSEFQSGSITVPTEFQQSSTNKNVKNVKNEKKKNTSRLKYEITDMENAKLLFQLMLENNENCKEPNWNSWANEMRLMRERDKRTDKQIQYVITWSQRDSFWKTNILSPSKLRKQFDQLIVRIKEEKEKEEKKKEAKQKGFDLSD
ncbi:hypothetical protein [Bacillus albus]|uniref:hypothetical protein n=1 Tax=Bacillus albus TaxID=2026189 RepID=UPI0010211452|nr:hypothetical protein [Bacillus albus]